MDDSLHTLHHLEVKQKSPTAKAVDDTMFTQD